MPSSALELRDDSRKGVGGVLDGAAEAARVQVDRSTDHVDLGVHHPAQGRRHRRDVALEEARVADHDCIRGQPVAVLAQPVLEPDGGVLLLALEQDPQVDRQPAAGRQDRLRRLEMHVQLALVVGGATPDDASVAHERLERGRLPQLDRVDRLDVVMAVDEDRGRALGVEPVRVDDRVAPRRRDVDMLEADPAPLGGDPLGRATNVRRVLGQGRDRRDPEQIEVRGQARVLRRIRRTLRPPGRWRPAPVSTWCSCRDGSGRESKRPAVGRALVLSGEPQSSGGATQGWAPARIWASPPPSRRGSVPRWALPPVAAGAAAGRGCPPSAGGR